MLPFFLLPYKTGKGKGIVRENPVPLKGVREADCTELLPTGGNVTMFSEGVKSESKKKAAQAARQYKETPSHVVKSC